MISPISRARSICRRPGSRATRFRRSTDRSPGVGQASNTFRFPRLDRKLRELLLGRGRLTARTGVEAYRRLERLGCGRRRAKVSPSPISFILLAEYGFNFRLRDPFAQA